MLSGVLFPANLEITVISTKILTHGLNLHLQLLLRGWWRRQLWVMKEPV